MYAAHAATTSALFASSPSSAPEAAPPLSSRRPAPPNCPTAERRRCAVRFTRGLAWVKTVLSLLLSLLAVPSLRMAKKLLH